MKTISTIAGLLVFLIMLAAFMATNNAYDDGYDQGYLDSYRQKQIENLPAPGVPNVKVPKPLKGKFCG